MKRLEKEFILVNSMGQEGVTATQKQTLFQWQININGPPGSPFEGTKLILDIEFPQEFPFKFPNLKFRNNIWHPNIKDGEICKQMLGEKQWLPNKKIKEVIETVISMLVHPDLNSAINLQAAKQFKEGTYSEKVKSLLKSEKN